MAEHADVDLSGLLEAEAAVAAMTGPAGTPLAGVPPMTDETRAAVAGRLEELVQTWKALDDGKAITLSFSRRP